jgi:5'-deoxynucleotidase YfbR-like HD superfamily hydrolase
MTTPFIETSTGTRFQPLAPIVNDIWIEDIAHHLSNQCRFSGATRRHYSVAEHSVRVSLLLEEWGEDEDVQMWGLLHDASEAYLVDLPTPLKECPEFLEAYQKAERVLMRAICARFSLPERQPDNVKVADAVLLATEVRDLMPARREHWDKLALKPLETRITPWWAPTTSFEDASALVERTFLQRFRNLEGRR